MRLFPQGNLSITKNPNNDDYLISGNYLGNKVEQTMNLPTRPILLMFDTDSLQFMPVYVQDATANWMVVDFLDK